MYNNIDSNDDVLANIITLQLSNNRRRIRRVPNSLPADVTHSLNKDVTIIDSKDVLSPISSSKMNSPSFLNKHRVRTYEYCLHKDDTCSLKKEIVADSNEKLPLSPSKICSLPFSKNRLKVPFCLPDEEVYTKKELKSIVKKCFANIKKNSLNVKQIKKMEDDINLKDYIIDENICDFIKNLCFSSDEYVKNN